MKLSLKARIMNAGSWILFGHMTAQLIRLASNLIMTRLLVPELFGVMAIAFIIITGMTMFSDVGIRQNIIQSSRGGERIFLNTAWSIQIIRGIILGIICLFGAYLLTLADQFNLIKADNVYSSHLLPSVLIVLALTPVFQGLESTKIAFANRNLHLNKIVLLELIAQLAGLAFMLSWVYFDRSIWALVSGAVFSAFVKMFLSHIILPGELNKLAWDKTSFHEIFHFGKWMFMTSILGFLVSQGDKLIIGGLLSARSFGLYSIAILLYMAIESVVTKLISSVVFPALGEVYRTHPEQISEKYYKIRLPVDVFCLFVAGFLFYSGSTLVNILYDHRYSESGSMLEILALLFLVIRFGVAGQFYLVMGKPKIMTILIFTRLVFMILFIPLGYQLNNDIGAVWGVVIAYFPGLLLTFYFKQKYGLLNVRKELLVIPVFFIGMFVGIFFDNLIAISTLN